MPRIDSGSTIRPASGSQLIRQLRASDRRLTAGSRIRARITIKLRVAAATDRMRLSLVATTGCSTSASVSREPDGYRRRSPGTSSETSEALAGSTTLAD